MADQRSSLNVSNPAQTAGDGKGKAKAEYPPHDVSMDEEDDSSDEETGAEEEVRSVLSLNASCLA